MTETIRCNIMHLTAGKDPVSVASLQHGPPMSARRTSRKLGTRMIDAKQTLILPGLEPVPEVDML